MNEQLITSTQSTDILSAAFLMPNLGVPFIMGLAIGYFTKTILKLVLFLGGGAIVLMIISEYYGFFTLSNAILQHASNIAIETAQNSGDFLINRLFIITGKGVGSVAGFYCGLKIG